MRFLKVFFAIILFSIVAVGQQNPNLDSGLNPYGSYHGGDVDSVSLINGNLTLHAPIAHYPQRGSLSVDYFLIANSKNWQVSSYNQGNPPTTFLLWTTSETYTTKE
jgi:hypothetical protein